MDTAEIRRRFLAHFEAAAGHTAVPVGVAAARRPQPAVRQRRHGALQALLPGPGDAAVHRARPACRSACAPPTSRTSARPPGTAPSSRCAATSPSATTSRRARSSSPGSWSPSRRPTAAAGSRRAGSTRASTTTTTRRSSCGEGHRPAGRPDRPARQEGELLVDGRARARAARARRSSTTAGPARSGRRPATGPTCRPSSRTATWRSGTWSSCRTSCSAVRSKEDFDIVGAAAEAEHRHRHGPGAGRVPAAGQGEHVRDRRDVPGHRAGRGAHRSRATAPTTATTSGSAWWPTTCAAR